MKFATVASAASLAAGAFAKTYTVTNTHFVTVYGNPEEVATAAKVVTVVANEEASSSPKYTPTTLETVVASFSSINSNTAPSSTAAPASGVYADIASSGVDATFAKNILDAHNAKRALHGVGDLSWDTTVYQYAQAYADKYTCGSGLVHSGGQYGENLASGYSTGVDAFDAWYSEGVSYDYSIASVFDHFTAIIWKGTTKLGCAYKDCGSGLYVICSYDPAGNVIGYGKENLFAS